MAATAVYTQVTHTITAATPDGRRVAIWQAVNTPVRVAKVALTRLEQDGHRDVRLESVTEQVEAPF